MNEQDRKEAIEYFEFLLELSKKYDEFKDLIKFYEEKIENLKV